MPGAYFGGEREGYQVANFPRRGQERGRSGNEQELHPSHRVITVHVPLNVKEAGSWWTEVKKEAAKQDSMKVSYRAKRWSAEGPGWYSLTAAGPGGELFWSTP